MTNPGEGTVPHKDNENWVTFSCNPCASKLLKKPFDCPGVLGPQGRLPPSPVWTRTDGHVSWWDVQKCLLLREGAVGCCCQMMIPRDDHPGTCGQVCPGSHLPHWGSAALLDSLLRQPLSQVAGHWVLTSEGQVLVVRGLTSLSGHVLGTLYTHSYRQRVLKNHPTDEPPRVQMSWRRTQLEAQTSSRMEGPPPAATRRTPVQGTVATCRTSHGWIKIQKPIIEREVGLTEHWERGPSGEWETLEGHSHY